MKNVIVGSILLLGMASKGWTQDNTKIEAVYLRKATNIEIDLSAGSLKVNEHYGSDKIFYQNFNKHSKEAVYYSDFDPITNLEAHTLTTDKSGVRKTKVSTIETKDIVQPGIFYGGYKRKDFVFPNLSSGAIGRLEYSKSITDVHLLTPFYFDEDVDVKHAEFTVTFPKSVKIRYKVYGALQNNIIFREQSLDTKTKYSWTLSDIPAYNQEENSPGRSFNAPHVVIFIDSYEYKGKTYRVLSDVSDLYSWYNSLVKTMPVVRDDALREMVKSLTQSSKNDEEKIKAIFQWTQKNIKYIAFENGMAGFVPRTAYDVYTKRYGDCKDMANLLKTMINMAGIDAYLTWIGTRSKPYSYADVPSAIADNHMICAVKLHDDFTFLDATNSYLTFGKPSSMIQGKEALIGINDHEFKIVKVPEVDFNENQRIDSLRINLQQDGIHGSFTSHLKGYKKDDIEIQHLKAAVHSDREYIRDFFTIGGNNIIIENPALTGLGDQNVPAVVNFKFLQPGYYKSVGDKIYLNLNFNKELPGEKIDIAKREQLLESEYAYMDKSVTIFTLPENFVITTLPTNTERKWPMFALSSQYTVHKNTIVLEKVFYSNFLYLDKSQFSDWNDLIQTMSSVNLQSIIITKSK